MENQNPQEPNQNLQAMITLASIIGSILSEAKHKNQPLDPSTARSGADQPYLVIKAEDNAETIQSLENLLSNPTRKRGTYAFADVGSFVFYVTKHAAESTQITGSLERGEFTATFDDHSAEVPGWCEHTAVYQCKASTEWRTWRSGNKSQMTQAAFARFIEDNLPDIIEPSGAEMLEISRTLEAKTNVNFKSSIRLSDGSREFNFEEKTEGSSGKFKVPETFKIAIPVFTGGAHYALEARLCYRIKEGALTMWYDLVRPHKTFEDAVKTNWEAIAAATEMTVLHVE